MAWLCLWPIMLPLYLLSPLFDILAIGGETDE